METVRACADERTKTPTVTVVVRVGVRSRGSVVARAVVISLTIGTRAIIRVPTRVESRVGVGVASVGHTEMVVVVV